MDILKYLWCVKVKVKVAQSCQTPWDPMDCSRPGSSVHEILEARTLECVAVPFPGDFPTQGSNLGLLLCRQTLSEPPGKPFGVYQSDTQFCLFAPENSYDTEVLYQQCMMLLIAVHYR